MMIEKEKEERERERERDRAREERKRIGSCHGNQGITKFGKEPAAAQK